jgi:hypothetical protein
MATNLLSKNRISAFAELRFGVSIEESMKAVFPIRAVPARLSRASGDTGLGFLTVVQGYYCLAQPLGALGMGMALSEKFSQQTVPVLAKLEKQSGPSSGRPVVLLHDDR